MWFSPENVPVVSFTVPKFHLNTSRGSEIIKRFVQREDAEPHIYA